MTAHLQFNKSSRIDFSRIRAICFDVDGTLCDTDDHLINRLARWLRFLDYLHLGKDSHTIGRWIVMTLENPGSYLYGIPDQLHVDHLISNLTDHFIKFTGKNRKNHPLPIIPGVIEMLEHIHAHYPMAVVSARGRRSTLSFLDHYQLTPMFKAVATGQTCVHTKPYPDPIIWAAEQMDVAPSECLMVGDTTVDIRAGKTAGAQTIGVLCGFGEEVELTLAGADLILPSTTDLLEVFPGC